MTAPSASARLFVELPAGCADLVATALEEAAAIRRRAAQAAAGEIFDSRQPGDDIRTESARVVTVLGHADVLERAAKAVRDYAGGMPVLAGGGVPAGNQVVCPLCQQPAEVDLPDRPSGLRCTRCPWSDRGSAPVDLGPLPADPHAAATVAQLRAAGPTVVVRRPDEDDDPAMDDVPNIDLGGGVPDA